MVNAVSAGCLALAVNIPTSSADDTHTVTVKVVDAERFKKFVTVSSNV